jgi:hypothetical protein
MCRSALYSSLVVTAAVGAGCMNDSAVPSYSGSLGGQVVVSGPLRNASISVDQLDLHTGEVYERVGDTTTDQDGRFAVDTALANGLLRVMARGGSFIDRATRATIQLDPTDEITSLVLFELAEVTDQVLVSPISHLIDARARAKLETLGDMTEAWKDASSHLGRHFGDVKDWSRLRLGGLDQPATSPTEELRAALVHVALSYLAQDIAAEAGSSPQEVNVFKLTHLWASDLARIPPRSPGDPVEDLPVWDGNDANDRRPGSGLQLGSCAPVESTCQVPADTCNTGHCRTRCDLYVGTARALLAGAMTKVIRDNGPGGANQTGLRIQDTLAIARSVSDNVDPDLFGSACIETLDRTAPELRWDEALSAPANAVVRGVIQMKAIAIDDVDPRPRVQIVGYTDLDGDLLNDVALANVDTTNVADGPLTVTARAVDLAGNSKTIERRVIVDNTPPQLTLTPAGFVDGSTWWITSSTLTLSGTIGDAAVVAVKAIVDGVVIPGTVSGTTWQVLLPAGTLDPAGSQVTVLATDAAGNQTQVLQRIRPDVSPPEVTLQPSIVNDEAPEVPTFATDESPIHSHNGMPVDLAASGSCPVVTKYRYLLGSASPPYVTETPARNPIAYKLVSADDGIGILDGSTQYRVLRRGASGSTVMVDWASAGAGTQISTGTRLFDVAVVSDLIPGLNITEAIYDVEFRATDRLSRTTSTSRCFELRLKSPPLHFGDGGQATGHTFALGAPNAPTSGLSLAPGAPYDLIATRLLNNNATGASLIDQWVTNGTTETVFLTVTVTKPNTMAVTQAFSVRNYQSVSTVSINCYDADGNWNPSCDQPTWFPSAEYYSSPTTTSATTLTFPAKLYELDGNGVPTTEIPCLAPCLASGSVFKFAVPPRAAGAAARRFVIMTMIGQVSNLWPGADVSPPFFDASLGGVRYTGKTQWSSTGCTKLYVTQAYTRCLERTQRIQYRALTYARLNFDRQTKTAYATAATPQITPVEARSPLYRDSNSGWETSEGPLP